MVKHVTEWSLVHGGMARLARVRHRTGVLVLAYHNIVPTGEEVRGDLSLHLPQRIFASQLDSLLRTHDVIALDDLFERPSAGRPAIVITFDDAYRGALTAGVAELARRGLPATVFVAPAFVDGGSFWWDETAGPDGLDPSIRTFALEDMGGEGERVRGWLAAHRMQSSASLPWHQHVASEEELLKAVSVDGLTLGSHTWNHPNLSTLEPVRLRAELERPLRWLEDRFPQRLVRWLSYPYGISSAEVAAAAEAAGYAGAFLVDGGWMHPGGNLSRFALPRFNVPAGLTLNGFRLRTAGVF